MNYLVDPTNITNYNQTNAELQLNLMFWIFAAGHNAKSTARGVEKFFKEIESLNISEDTPFQMISDVAQMHGWNYITNILSQSGLGCWRIKSRTVRELVEGEINLHECSVEELEAIYGIGPKTARCFLLHSRKGIRVAGLDVHVLRFLHDQGIKVPKSTPTGKHYKVLEQEFLRLCDKVGMEPAAYDLAIWNEYRKKS